MKIPIANLYYLLCYAWRHVEATDTRGVSELSSLNRVQDLFGHILARGTLRLVKRGLDRGYHEVREDLAGIRGRIDLGQMAKRALGSRCLAACIFEELSHDVLHNQILKSTLVALEECADLDRRTRAEVRAAHRRLDSVGVIELDRRAFRRVQLDGGRGHYRFLLSVCELVYDSILIDEATGVRRFLDIREDELRMSMVFEEFVRGFYRREQRRYSVNRGGRVVPWSDADGVTEADRALIPNMHADIILEEGRRRRIILDTKFYAEATSSRWGTRRLHSGNLYQLLAYLRNREATAPAGAKHEGLLLYPVVEQSVSAEVRLEGFRIRAYGIDLRQGWQGIHNDLLAIVA